MRNIIALFVTTFSVSAFSLTALDEKSLSNVVAKGGLTIESTSLDSNGQLFSTGKITFNEFDTNSTGQDGFSINGIKLLANDVDENGNISGASTIKTSVDLGNDGSLFVKTTGFQRVDLEVGAVSLGRRTLIDGLKIENARFLGNSYTAMKVSNELRGTKLAFITQLGNGSNLTQSVRKNDVVFSSKVTLNGVNSDPNSGFYSEMFLLAQGDDLRLEFGRIKGSVLMNNIVMNDTQGRNLFSNKNFGSLGLSDINIRNGYLTLDTRSTNDAGIRGKFLLQAQLGSLFIENDGGRINLSAMKLDMDSEIAYQMEFFDDDKNSGVQMSFAPVNADTDTDIDFELGAINLAGVGGANPSKSMGSFAIENLNLRNNKLRVSIFASPNTGSNDGIRTDISLEGTTKLDLVVKDDFLNRVNAPELRARVSLSNFKVSQRVDLTRQGINININRLNLDMKVHSVKIGNGLNYRGQMGRLALNSFKVLPGSYTLIKPL